MPVSLIELMLIYMHAFVFSVNFNLPGVNGTCVQIVAVITPGDGSGNSSDTAPDLALIGVPVAAPFPTAPASPSPAPAVPPSAPLAVQAPTPATTSPALNTTTPVPNPFMPPPAIVSGSVPPATTPAPALAAGVPIQVRPVPARQACV